MPISKAAATHNIAADTVVGDAADTAGDAADNADTAADNLI